MDCKLIFMRRTPKEIEVFGGEVYIDINGRNIGLLSKNDIERKVSSGTIKIKMYKSHTFNSFIGHSEIELDIKEGEKLLIRYSPPMLVNQPGNIIISEYKSKEETESIIREQEYNIVHDYNEKEEKKHELEEQTKNGMIIFVVLIIISLIIYAFNIAEIYNF